MTTTTNWTGRDWRIEVSDEAIAVTHPGGDALMASSAAARLEVRRRFLRWRLYNDGDCIRLPGLRRRDAATLDLALRRLKLLPVVTEVVSWHANLVSVVTRARAEQRWIPREAFDALASRRPDPVLAKRIRAAGLESSLSEDEVAAVRALEVDLERLVAETNDQIMAAELSSRRSFFETIEKSPLTDEQARSVACFDNRVQVLAAAGSGKTSVMVARAAYAVERGFIPPERILMLAFNRNAAAELRERVTERFAAAGIDSSGVRASNFHSFGLDVIGRATGEKPRVARWVAEGRESDTILEIVDELRDSSHEFRYRWDLYRLLFATAPTTIEELIPDAYDSGTKENGYRTFGGEIVKSHGERFIANFMYLNGVKYQYERRYAFPVADATHSQYQPDFYYPDIDVWHEHWALDRDGRPPTEFSGYVEGMDWKRRIHREHGTTLVETTWADVMFGDGLAKLGDQLTQLGLTLDWNPERPVRDRWAKPMQHEELAGLIRTFMAHVKSNSWRREDLDRRLQSEVAGLNGYRTRLFLDVYWPIHAEWERRLATDNSVDFEDMLVRAAGYLEAGSVDCSYDLILVDEFQDASRARARLVRALVNKPDRYLLAVGDDWQAINRFAGADIGVMTEFDTWFGRGQQLALTTTFRCSQTICDVASTFVSKNPAQFRKPMRSFDDDPGAPVRVICDDNTGQAVAQYLEELSQHIANGALGERTSASVDILGRYRFQQEFEPARTPSNLHVTFRTAHSSKGLEADFVVIVGMTTGRYGFPSAITDDPVLALAMPAPESFAHAEERRLFYVALTRARLEVALITSQRTMSPFVVELLSDPRVTVVNAEAAPVEVCTVCRKGILVERSGPFGRFLGCSTFPVCRHTRSVTTTNGS